ncbi:MAG: CaiB/BaiF CoA-transferase family protein [Candidatus Bathyarchaeota archaeon]|jgi:formyl-CoA transferase/CoA:oxalate CoA-transferase|nr:CaiB/BaiF CoA-transferase family protein [Candidatus Bathyarchaeota archaeon]
MSDNVGEPPLKGVRVLDLSRVLAGPFCSMTLSELGAEVIKVEIPDRGDDTRTYPPFVNGESSYFMSINRGKKSVTLNLKNMEAQKALYKIAEKCDVFLENYRPGVTTRLGVDYATLKKVNPSLVYCSISSFGQTGPYAQRPGYDLIIQGMGGLMGVTGEPGAAPVKIGVAITDIGAGMWAVIAILSALRAREKTGKGQYLDVSMIDGSVSWMTYMAGYYFATGKAAPKMGSAHPSIVPYQAFRAADGKDILVAAGNDPLFGLLCSLLGLKSLSGDPLYMRNEDRVKNRETLIPLLQEELSKKPRDEWLETFRDIGFPSAPVYSIDEVFSDEQVLHRGMLVEVDHPKAGRIKQIGPALKFSDMCCEGGLPSPGLGAHTDEVLEEIAGYSPKEVAGLRERGAI